MASPLYPYRYLVKNIGEASYGAQANALAPKEYRPPFGSEQSGALTRTACSIFTSSGRTGDLEVHSGFQDLLVTGISSRASLSRPLDVA